MNNCFSIFTRSDLNRIRKETIKKRFRLIDGWIHAWTRSRVNSGCPKVRSLQYLQTRQMIVLIFLYRGFVSFSINGLKENAENLNHYPILRRKVELYLFLSTHREFSLSLLANTVNSGYDQGERCLSPMFFALLTCWHVQFSKIFAFLFSP